MFSPRHLIAGAVVVLSVAVIATPAAVAMPIDQGAATGQPAHAVTNPRGSTPVDVASPAYSRQEKQLTAPTPKRRLATGSIRHNFSHTDAAITAGLAALALLALASGLAISRRRAVREDRRPALTH